MKKAVKICSQYLFVFFLLVPASLFGQTVTVYEETFDSPWNTGDWDQYTPEGGSWATQLAPFICQGDQSVSHWDNGEPVNGWIISDLISLQAGITYTCSFQQRVGNSSFPENMGTYIYQGNGADFTPGTATAVIWQADNLTNEICSSRSNTFTVPSDGNYNIVFHCTSAADEFIATWDYVKITRPTQAPTVTTQAVTNIGTTTATGNGNITSLGVPNPTAHGVCWNTAGTPTLADNNTDEGAAGATGAFTGNITGLSPNTTYYVRAYATNTADTAYGNQVSFTTNPQAPTVTTQAVTGITITTATGNGNITDLGTPNPTAHGVCWNTAGTPTLADNNTDEGAAGATGAFTGNITGLSPNTTYYVRAYATNTADTVYGNQVSFTTEDNSAPTDISLSNSSVVENQPVGTTVGTFSTTDPDAGDTHTCSLVGGAGDDDNSSFTIDGNTLKTNEIFDHETKNTYSIRVRTTDAGGLSCEEQFNITVTQTPPPPDSDNDGVPDSWEQGPDGDDPDYDGNGDGIPDCRQSNVTSFHTWDTSGGRHYITLEVPEGQRIKYPYALRTFETEPPSGVSFPYGFFTFKITGLEEGGTTTMIIYLDGEPPQTYYKYGKTPDNPADHWYEFSYDGETGAEKVGNTIVLHFTDGLRGDHDLKVNGEIQDPGGPAAIETLEVLYFPYLISTDEEETLTGIINTENYTVTSTISYYGQDGDLITTADMTLKSKGKTTISSDSIPSDTATAIISADGILSGYTRYVNSQGQRCAWPANMQPQDSIPVPHTAINSNWATGLCLFNPNDEDVEVTLDYYSGISGNLTLIAKSQDFFYLTESEPVSSISSTGYIAAMEMFDSLTSGGDRAALLLRKRYLNALYVPCISYGAEEFTGVGLINGYHDGTISVFGHSETGEVEEVALGSLSALSRITADISGILNDDNLWARISGETDFIGPFGASSMLFYGLAVYGEDNTGKLGAINLNALKFKEGFLGIISTDPEPFFALLNPDTVDALIAVTGYNSDGDVLASNTIQIEAGSNMTGVVSDLFEDISLTDVTHIRIVSDVNIYGSETIYTDDRMEMLPVLAVD